jgi:hypothetical protein
MGIEIEMENPRQAGVSECNVRVGDCKDSS